MARISLSCQIDMFLRWSISLKDDCKMFFLTGSLVLLAGVAVAIAVPLSLKQDTVQTSLEEANQLLSENPVIDGLVKLISAFNAGNT